MKAVVSNNAQSLEGNIMKIDSSSFTSPPLRTAPASQKPAENSARAADAVVLSNSPVKAQGSEKPPVNAAKIQEIKEAISQGRFRINPEAIADGLIETAKDLVNSQRKA
jgi:negative regulator of flagellin synthesis FlgM